MDFVIVKLKNMESREEIHREPTITTLRRIESGG
jgi:hypothetical protein